MTTYPYASNAKIQASRDAIGAAFIGSQEVTILKQILVATAAGGITPPFEPIVITAPDGAYSGAALIITGGVYAIYAVGDYVVSVDNELPAVQVYQFVINGTPVGDWVTSPSTIPNSVIEGDEIQVSDIAGNLSNTLIAISPPISPSGVGFMSTRGFMGGAAMPAGSSGKEAIISFKYEIPYGLDSGWKVPYLGVIPGGVDILACIAIIEEPGEAVNKVQVTFSGSNTASILNNSIIESDGVDIVVAPSSIIRIATFFKATNNGVLPRTKFGYLGNNTKQFDQGIAGDIGTLDEDIIWNDTIPISPTGTPAVLGAGNPGLIYVYHPVGIIGKTNPSYSGDRTVLAFIGDSICNLENDFEETYSVLNPPFSMRGYAGRSFGVNVPFIVFAQSGGTGNLITQGYANQTDTFTYIFGGTFGGSSRLRKITHVANEYGINSIRTQRSDGNDAIATWSRRLEISTIIDNVGCLHAQSTLTPMTSANLIGYAGHGDAAAQFAYFVSQRGIFNSQVRDDSLTIPGCIGFIDHAKGVETDYITNGNTWLALATADGLHPTTLGHKQIALQYDLSLFTNNPNPLPT